MFWRPLLNSCNPCPCHRQKQHMSHAKHQTQSIPRARPCGLELIVLGDQVEHAKEVVEGTPDDEHSLPAKTAARSPGGEGSVCLPEGRFIHVPKMMCSSRAGGRVAVELMAGRRQRRRSLVESVMVGNCHGCVSEGLTVVWREEAHTQDDGCGDFFGILLLHRHGSSDRWGSKPPSHPQNSRTPDSARHFRYQLRSEKSRLSYFASFLPVSVHRHDNILIEVHSSPNLPWVALQESPCTSCQ